MNAAAIPIIIDLGVVAVGAVAGWLYLKSRTTKTLQGELQQLVSLRGEMIEDLQEKVDQLADRVDALEAEMDAVYKIKAKEIADLVIAGVVGSD